MDKEKIEVILSITVAISTFISALYGIRQYTHQKSYDKTQKAFENFYIPLFKLIDKHLYKINNFKSQSFNQAISNIRNLISEQYMYVPFELQSAFEDFCNSNNTQKEDSYLKFCDCFISNYREVSNICKQKQINTPLRNKMNWYVDAKQRILCNIIYCFSCIYFILIGISISGIFISITFYLFNLIGITTI